MPTLTSRSPGAFGSVPVPRSSSTSQRAGVQARGQASARQLDVRREPLDAGERDEVAGDRALAEEDDRRRARGARCSSSFARTVAVERGVRLRARRPGRRTRPPAPSARRPGSGRPPARRSGPARSWSRRARRSARPSRSRSRRRRAARPTSGGEPCRTRGRRRTALPSCRGLPAPVARRLRAVAADRHRAPVGGAVARVVVEDPAARVLAARLEPRPRPGLGRRDRDRGERRERRGRHPLPQGRGSVRRRSRSRARTGDRRARPRRPVAARRLERQARACWRGRAPAGTSAASGPGEMPPRKRARHPGRAGHARRARPPGRPASRDRPAPTPGSPC